MLDGSCSMAHGLTLVAHGWGWPQSWDPGGLALSLLLSLSLSLSLSLFFFFVFFCTRTTSWQTTLWLGEGKLQMDL